MTPQTLTPERYLQLKPYFEGQPHPLCAYSLPGIISWRTAAYDARYIEMDGALIVAAHFAGDPAKGHMLLPISPARRFTPQGLHDLSLVTGIGAFGFVPESYIEREGRFELERYFDVVHQPEYDDYIYKTRDLAELKGNRYSKKRNLIHQFHRFYMDADRVKTEALTPRVAEECLAFLNLWCEEHDCENQPEEDLACEKQACANMLHHIGQFDVSGLLVRIDGKVAAFGIGARLTDRMGVLHFEKALSSVKGLYQYLDQLCAIRLFAGFEHINKESDMGVEGLARAKKSYYPMTKEKSYRLTAK